jgi:hypothetical protein
MSVVESDGALLTPRYRNLNGVPTFTGLCTKRSEIGSNPMDPLAGWYFVGQDEQSPLSPPLRLENTPAAAAFCMTLFSIYDEFEAHI